MPSSSRGERTPKNEWTYDEESGFLSLKGWSGEELPPPPPIRGVYGISLEDCVADSATSVERCRSFRELRLTRCRFARRLVAARQKTLMFLVVESSLDSLDLLGTASLHNLIVRNDHIRCEPDLGLRRLQSLTLQAVRGDPLAILTDGREGISLDVRDSEIQNGGTGVARVERASFRDVSGWTGDWVRRMSGLQSVTLQGKCDGALEAMKHAPELVRLKIPGDHPREEADAFCRSRPEVRLYLGLRSYERYTPPATLLS